MVILLGKMVISWDFVNILFFWASEIRSSPVDKLIDGYESIPMKIQFLEG